MSADNTGAVPTVKLPKAVMRQKEQTDKLIEDQKVLKEKVQEEFNKATSTGNQTVQKSSEPESTPNQPVVTQTVEPNTQTQTTTVEPEKDAKYWEHRFKTSQGMFEAEKTRLKSEIVDLKGKIGNFDSKFRELEDKLRATEKAAARQVNKTIDLKKYLSEEQIEAYGPELLNALMNTVSKAAEDVADDASERRIREEIERHVDPVKQKLELSEKELIARKSANFLSAIEQKVPDWMLINDDLKFHSWLSQKDQLSGFTRQQLLTLAEEAFDDERVVALFEAFKKSSPAPKTTANLDDRVVPDPVGQTTIVTKTNIEIPFVSRAEINQFYTDCKLGRYRQRPQEKAEMERKIRAAADAGRVI